MRDANTVGVFARIPGMRVVCAARASGNARGDPGALLRTVGSQPGWDFAHDTSRSRFGDHQVHRGKYGDVSRQERGDRKI